MYNLTKRIVITKDNQIVLAGQKSWRPIGKFYSTNGQLIGKLCKVENPFETRLDDTNSHELNFKTLGQLREFVKTTYEGELIKYNTAL